MGEKIDTRRNTVDAIVVGGGSVGLHTAHALHETMGKSARILAVTQEGEWGGIASRSLEQYRMFNDSYAMAEIVNHGIKLYDRLDMELAEQNSTARAYEEFPYVFTVGTKQRPDHISEMLPSDTPDRLDMDDYRSIIHRMKLWGVDPQAYELSSDDLRKEFPMLNGDGIEGAVVVDNAGRLHFDTMRSWMMEGSRADSNGRGVTYRANTTARQILLGKDGKAIGVDFGNEKIYSDKIILALGQFVVNLAQLLQGDESLRIAKGFTITQRELFFANMPGVREDTNFFVISPDMAIARISTHEGHASYGYAADDDLVISKPVTDPRPDGRHMEEYYMKHKDLFVGRTYAMLSECSSRWDADRQSDNKLALSPTGHSAGSYTAYRDDLPVVGEIGDTGAFLVAGSHHSGIMGGRGLGLLAVDHALGTQNLSQCTHEQTDINRIPQEHTGLVL